MSILDIISNLRGPSTDLSNGLPLEDSPDRHDRARDHYSYMGLIEDHPFSMTGLPRA